MRNIDRQAFIAYTLCKESTIMLNTVRTICAKYMKMISSFPIFSFTIENY